MNITRLVDKVKPLAQRLYEQTKKHVRRRWRRYIVLVALSILLGWGYWWLLHRFPPKRVATFTFLGIWLFQFMVGVGAGFAIYRLWRDRDNSFIKRTMVELCSSVIIAITSFVLLFIAQGVRFTWKFSITLFVAMFLWSAMTAQLVLFVIRGPKASAKPEQGSVPKSGDLPPDYWMAQFEDLRKRIDGLNETISKVKND